MVDQQQSRSRPTRKQLLRTTVGKRLLWTTVGILAVIVAIVGACIFLRLAYVREWQWTGLVKNPDFHKRTLWDWLNLLIVPAVLALGGYLFTRAENRRTQDVSRRQRIADREIANQRRYDAALRAYLTDIGKLLLDKDEPLRGTGHKEEPRILARARTIAVLRTLDRNHYRILFNFLQEARLLLVDDPVISFKHADLSQFDLGDMIFSRAMLSEVNLRKANLRGAELIDGTDLSESDLEEANLEGAILDYYKGAFAGARYFQQSGSAWPLDPGDPKRETHLIGTNLKKANLRNAVLTDKQIHECKSLEGATMPNGQKYEDWLKDREAHKEDAEND